MAYASKLGRARISSRRPQAAAICDRCSFAYNHVDLQWQFDWAGPNKINKRILVCRTCLDVAQEQLRAIILPADPVPIEQPRIQDWQGSETNARYTSGDNTTDQITGIPIIGGNQRITQDDNIRVVQQTGEPIGGKNQQPGTDPDAPGDNDPGLPYNYTEVPKTGPLGP